MFKGCTKCTLRTLCRSTWWAACARAAAAAAAAMAGLTQTRAGPLATWQSRRSRARQRCAGSGCSSRRGAAHLAGDGGGGFPLCHMLLAPQPLPGPCPERCTAELRTLGRGGGQLIWHPPTSVPTLPPCRWPRASAPRTFWRPTCTSTLAAVLSSQRRWWGGAGRWMWLRRTRRRPRQPRRRARWVRLGTRARCGRRHRCGHRARALSTCLNLNA